MHVCITRNLANKEIELKSNINIKCTQTTKNSDCDKKKYSFLISSQDSDRMRQCNLCVFPNRKNNIKTTFIYK